MHAGLTMDEPVTLNAVDDCDVRLYVPELEGWTARVKGGWEKLYCFYKQPGQDYFHLLMGGEIYLERGEEVVCLMCALRRGIVTTDRLHWQHRGRGTARQSREV
jgi:hypothetical protein